MLYEVIPGRSGALPFSRLVADDRAHLEAHGDDLLVRPAQALAAMAKEVDTASGGKMKLRIYPGGQMGGPRETLELLQNGALDMTKASASEMEPFAPAFSVFSLPYLFKDQDHFNKVIYGPVGKAMMEETRSKGFISLAAYVAGTRSFYAKKAIHSPADMKGLKIRVVATPTTIKMIELLGAAPAPIPFGERNNFV